MIEILDFLEKHEREDLESFESFLEAAGVSDEDYAIVSGYDMGDAICAIDYSQTEDGMTFCKMRFPMRGGDALIEQWLGDAGWFLCFLMTSGWLEKTKSLSAGAGKDEAFAAFDLDSALYLKAPNGGDDPTGPYIAADEDGFAYYMFDDNGELALNAISQDLAPLVVRLAVDLHMEESDFLETLAEHYPD